MSVGNICPVRWFNRQASILRSVCTVLTELSEVLNGLPATLNTLLLVNAHLFQILLETCIVAESISKCIYEVLELDFASAVNMLIE